MSAIRVPPPTVSPVVSEGIAYSAHGDGQTGYVIASDVTTGKELWKVKIFHIHIKPWIEATTSGCLPAT